MHFPFVKISDKELSFGAKPRDPTGFPKRTDGSPGEIGDFKSFSAAKTVASLQSKGELRRPKKIQTNTCNTVCFEQLKNERIWKSGHDKHALVKIQEYVTHFTTDSHAVHETFAGL